MKMYFDTMVKMTNILFEGWDTYSTKDVVLASLIAFVATILYEGLKATKQHLIVLRKQHPLSLREDVAAETQSMSSTTDLMASLHIPADLSLIQRRKKMIFVLESMLHTSIFLYGYFIMLLVMTYNVWFLIAVILGSGFGYFIFPPLGLYFRRGLGMLDKLHHHSGQSHRVPGGELEVNLPGESFVLTSCSQLPTYSSISAR